MIKLPTLSDIEQGAEVYLKAPLAKEVTPVERAAYSEFMEAIDVIVDCEWHLQVIALLLTGEARKAMDFLNGKISDNQPEIDHWGNAADRGNDERGIR